MMSYGLFRASHSHNPTQYSHIVKLTLPFYAHIGRVNKSYKHSCASTSCFMTFDPDINYYIQNKQRPQYLWSLL